MTSKGLGTEPTIERTTTDAGEQIIVKGITPDTNLTVNITDFRNNLRDLHGHHATLVDKLPSEQSVKFAETLNACRLLYKTAAYDVILHEVLDAFKDINSVRAGTVGAFFKGCFVPSLFHGNHSCSDVCAGSLVPSETTNGWQQCEDLVILYKGKGSFLTLNTASTTGNAMVYVEDSNFQGFTDDEIKQLGEGGIKKVQLYSSNGGNYKEINPSIPIASLPRKRSIPSAPNPSNHNNNNNDERIIENNIPRIVTGGGGGNGGIIIMVIIIIIIVLLLLLFLWKAQYL